MKFDFQIDKNEDLEYFKTLFYRNMDTEQMLYHFHMDDITVRVQVSGFEESQLIKIGFFNVTKEKNTSSIEQFHPCSDSRFNRFEAITGIWSFEPSNMWATYSHREDGQDEAFALLMGLLLTVYKVNKLKSFL